MYTNETHEEKKLIYWTVLNISNQKWEGGTINFFVIDGCSVSLYGIFLEDTEIYTWILTPCDITILVLVERTDSHIRGCLGL